MIYGNIKDENDLFIELKYGYLVVFDEIPDEQFKRFIYTQDIIPDFHNKYPEPNTLILHLRNFKMDIFYKHI